MVDSKVSLHLLFYFIQYWLCSYSLEVADVTLASGDPYVHLQEEKAVSLECKYGLEKEESVSKISWYHDGTFVYSWQEGKQPTIGNDILEEDIRKDKGGGHLEFKKMKMKYTGLYRCDVTLTSGVTSSSHSYQLLVIDMPNFPIQSNSKIEDCVLKFSWIAPAINPRPRPICGVWSEKHGYSQSATTWLATPYYNGSISYILEEEPFEISFMPLAAIIKCELSITRVDDTVIQLVGKIYTFAEISERGCSSVEADETMDLTYENEDYTCHHEIKAKDKSKPLIARIKCKGGYEPKYADLVTMVELICKDSEWNVGGDLTWNHYENLMCVPEEKVPKTPTLPPLPKLKEKVRGTYHDTPSSGTQLLSSLALVLLLTAGFSALVRAFQILNKKKSARFMD